MSDVFISYKRRLRPQVERIAAALRELRIDVWFDAALEPGVSFSAEISHEVRNAGCVLVCWSNDAFPHGGDENGWVLGEASIGRKRGRLVTVTLEDTEFDPPWNMIHSERLVGFDPMDLAADRSAWRGMLAAIGRLIERPGLADYDRAVAAGTVAALKGWVQAYPEDLLAEGVWARIEEIELATVRKRLAEERVAPAPASAPTASLGRAEPDRLYAALPEIVSEDPAPASQPEPRPEGAKPSSPPRRRITPAIAAAVACAICAVGAVLASFAIGDASDGPLFITVVLGGPAAAMIVIAIALVVSGYLTVWRAIALFVAGNIGFYLAVLSADFLTLAAPSFGTEGADILGGFVLGGLGSAIVLLTLVMLARNPNLGRLVPIALSGVLLIGVTSAVVMLLPGMSIKGGGSVGIWAASVWYVALGLILMWLLAEPETG